MTSFSQPADHGAPTSALPAQSMIPLSAIDPSPFNPRKTFDDIDELAESIKAQGLLENLVVRPAKKAGRYELIAGERRFRALQKLKAGEVPCKVIAADDGQARAAQIVENLQRADVNPLEEAEGFKGLQDADPKRWTVQAIAASVGKTPRFVQQRLAIATGLAPEARALMAKGEMKVDVARTLAMAPPSIQKEILHEHRHWHTHLNAEQIREEIVDRAVPIDRAAFDISKYDGPFLKDGKARLFADVAKFDSLQQAAAEALVEKLKAAWPDAQLVTDSTLRNWAWADSKDNLGWSSNRKGGKATGALKVAKEKCTAIVWIDGLKALRSAQGVCRAALFDRPTPASSGHTVPNKETPEQKSAREAFLTATATAAAKKPDLVKRLVLMSLIDSEIAFEVEEVLIQRISEALPKELPKFMGRLWNDDHKAQAWKHVQAMKPAAVDQAFAGFAAAMLDWSGYRPKPPKILSDVASQLGVTLGKAATAKATAKPKAKPKAKAKKKGGRK